MPHCFKMPQTPKTRANFIFLRYPGFRGFAAPPWAIILSPRFAGLKIPLAYGSQSILQLPIYRAA